MKRSMSDNPKDYAYGLCGVFCEMCPTGNGTISHHASELSRLMNNEFGWAKDSVDFEFENLRKGLAWLSKITCPTCHNIENPRCEVMRCEKVRELGSCLLCDELPECPRLEYQRGRYPFILEYQLRVKEVGLVNHLAEERERARKGVCLFKIRSY